MQICPELSRDGREGSSAGCLFKRKEIVAAWLRSVVVCPCCVERNLFKRKEIVAVWLGSVVQKEIATCQQRERWFMGEAPSLATGTI